MAYTKNPQWKDYPDESTPVTAERLNHLEDGVYAAAATADSAAAGLSGKADTGHTHTPASIGAAAASHQHAAGDISSGTLDVARVPNLSASKVTSGTFDEARIPSLPGSKITSGTIAPARLGTGTADDTKFLRGDGTWQVPPESGGGGGVAPLIRTPAVGRWMTSPNFIATGFSTTGEVRNDGRMPLYVPEAMTIDQVAFSVGTAEEAANWTVTLLDDTGATLSTLGSADLSTTGQKVITLAEPLALDPGWYFIKGSGHTWNAAKFCTARITGWGSASNRPDPVFVSTTGWPPVDEFNVGWQQNVAVFWVRRSA